MNEEKELTELSKKFPTVQYAMSKSEGAKEQLKVVVTLCKE